MMRRSQRIKRGKKLLVVIGADREVDVEDQGVVGVVEEGALGADAEGGIEVEGDSRWCEGDRWKSMDVDWWRASSGGGMTEGYKSLRVSFWLARSRTAMHGLSPFIGVCGHKTGINF